MRIYFKILLVGFFSFMVFACGNSSNLPSGEAEAVLKKTDFSKVLPGRTFFGVLPCASCPGIETRISLQEDSKVQLEQFYEENDESPSLSTGTYEIKNNILALSFTNKEDNQRYKIKADTLITLLGEDDTEVKGENAEQYNLRLVPVMIAEQLVGNYVKKAGAKVQGNLKLSYDEGKQQYSLQYISQDKLCNLHSKSRKLNTNRLFFALDDLQKDAKIILTLTFREGTVAIYMDSGVDKDELQALCNNHGLEILGIYTKLDTKALKK